MRSVRQYRTCLLFCLIAANAAPVWCLDEQMPSAGPPVEGVKGLDRQLLEGLDDLTKQGQLSDGNELRTAADENSGVPPQDTGEAVNAEPPHPLVPIRNAMRQAEQLLVAGELSQETQDTQRQILLQLDALIESLATSQASAQQQQRQQQKTSAAPAGGSQQQAGRQSTSSGEGTPNEEDVPVLPAMELQQVVGEYWGHLPERVRRRLRSTEAMEFLPRYRDIIEDYYKRLSDDPNLR